MLRRSDGFFGHYVIEVFLCDFPSVAGSPLEHFLKLAGVHGLAQLLGNSLDVVNVDGSGPVVVEKVENTVDSSLS